MGLFTRNFTGEEPDYAPSYAQAIREVLALEHPDLLAKIALRLEGHVERDTLRKMVTGDKYNEKLFQEALAPYKE